MNINAIKIDKSDNVVIAIEKISSGEYIKYSEDSNSIIKLKSKEDIKIFHKVAITDIHENEHVIKYGENIGFATTNIHKGEWVHIHNVIGRRENLEI